MAVGKFQHLRGAAADVAELEYISALHQTGLHVRQDASINAEDIRLFLSSRYGIDVTNDDVKKSILFGLGGGNDVLDLMELVACLLIPTFLKASYQINGIDLPTHVVPTQDNLLPLGLKVILHDATGSSQPKAITTDLMRRLLVAYGEIKMSEDTDLLQEMVDCCGEDSRYLTVEAFSDALSSDLHLLDVENEVRLTTNMDDVILTKTVESYRLSKTESIAILHGSEREAKIGKRKGLLEFSLPLKLKKTLSQIDITAANYRSKTLMVLLYATFLITYYTYLFENLTKDIDDICGGEVSTRFAYSSNSPWAANSDVIICEVFVSVFLWLVYFITISVTGVLFITLGSTGNSINCQRWWVPLIGALVVAGPVIALYAAQDTGGVYLDNASLVLGGATIAYHLGHSASLAFPPLRKIKIINSWLATDSVYAEMKQKRSAAAKMSSMTSNALKIVTSEDDSNVFQTYYGRALQMYTKKGKKYVEIGGFAWSWRRILLRKFSDYDGIWMSARLVASNISQYIVSLYVLIFGIDITRRVSNGYNKDEAEDQLRNYVARTVGAAGDEGLVSGAVDNVTSIMQSFLAANTAGASGVDFGCANYTETSQDFFEQYCSSSNSSSFAPYCDKNSSVNFLCPLVGSEGLTTEERLALLSASGFNDSALAQSLQETVAQGANHVINSLYPSEKYMVVIPAVVATTFAFLVAVYLSVSYMPSVLNTILKLRSGEIATLRNPNFFKVRIAHDLVSVLTGSLFWGAIGSSVVVGGSFGLIVFFFLWQATAYYAQRLVALIAGMVVVTVVRILFLRNQRKKFFRAFYRERPLSGNLLLLALDWAYFSLTAGYIIVRIVKLMLCAAACIGRIDTPFLAPGIGRVGPIDFDHYPTVHLQEILSHEAHRHPYIEQLGVIYMMKMRYGDRFGTRACSAWRLLFVYALFPWLHQYRIAARPNLLEEVDIEDDPSSMVQLSRFLNLSHPTIRSGGASKRRNLTACQGDVEKQNERIRDLEEELKLLRAKYGQTEKESQETFVEPPTEQEHAVDNCQDPGAIDINEAETEQGQSSTPVQDQETKTAEQAWLRKKVEI